MQAAELEEEVDDELDDAKVEKVVGVGAEETDSTAEELEEADEVEETGELDETDELVGTVSELEGTAVDVETVISEELCKSEEA